MKQNKLLQITIYITTILVQICGLMYFVSHSEQSFDTTAIPALLLKYGMTIVGGIIVAGLIYGGHYVKKYRASWIQYAEINIFFPLLKGFGINTGFYVFNLVILGIMDFYSKELSTELLYLLGKILIMLAINVGALLFIILIYCASLPPKDESVD